MEQTAAPAATQDPPASAAAPARWVEQGRLVVRTEAAALEALANSLGEDFEAAVALILATTGHVVVSGIGKSGHIARKTASTFASVGLPAYFLHPAEAAHGDLGTVVPGDTAILFTNSGATKELKPLARHVASLDVPMVVITSHRTSPLAALADIRLELPAFDEAGPSKIAPTTSTTMMLALGDALALTAMRDRGQSRAGFGRLHPGGTLGSLLGPASAVMHGAPDIPLVERATPMRDAILVMTGFRFGITGVVDGDGRLVGVITDGDLRRHIDDLLQHTAGDVMTPDALTVPASSLAEDALLLMNQHKVTAIFVTGEDEASRPVGLIHVHDLLGGPRS